MFKCINDCFCNEVYVKMGRSIVKSIASKHWGFSTLLEVLLPGLRGEHFFEKCTPKTASVRILEYQISLSISSFRARTKFSIFMYSCL